MKLLLVICAMLAITNFVSARPNDKYDDTYDDDGILNDNGDNEADYDGEDDDGDDAEEDNGPPPEILSGPLTLTAKPGETIQLPCNTIHAEHFSVMWKKNGSLLFQDKIEVGQHEPRYTRFANRTLQISDVTPNDTSEYECSVATENLISVTHKLMVLTPPRIEKIETSPKIKDGITEVKVGGILVLECLADGNPKPKVIWSKEGNRVHDKHGRFEGATITIDNIGREHAGLYQCMADNKIGNPATAALTIRVTHPPVIRVDKMTVNSAEGYESVLTCMVHAVPKAHVMWKKNNESIVADNNIVIDHNEKNHRHTLKILRTQKADFGSYSCYAQNKLGHSEKHLTLAGEPAPAQFQRTQFVGKPKTTGVLLVWTVESNSPISEYNLEYRSKGQDTWIETSPKVTNSEGNLYTVEQVFENLSGVHEARLKSKNTYGWSQYSQTISFEGIDENDEVNEEPVRTPENQKEPAASYSSGSEKLIASSSLFFIAVISAYYKFV